MFDDELEVCWDATGAAQAAGHLDNFEAKGSGLCRLTGRHKVSYGTSLTASLQSRSLCVFGSGRLVSPGRRNVTRLVRLMVDF